MAKQKSKKSALKRFRKTNPKGNRKGKVLYKQSAQHHLRTKLSRRSKRRKKSDATVYVATERNIKKKIVNIYE